MNKIRAMLKLLLRRFTLRFVVASTFLCLSSLVIAIVVLSAVYQRSITDAVHSMTLRQQEFDDLNSAMGAFAAYQGSVVKAGTAFPTADTQDKSGVMDQAVAVVAAQSPAQARQLGGYFGVFTNQWRAINDAGKAGQPALSQALTQQMRANLVALNEYVDGQFKANRAAVMASDALVRRNTQQWQRMQTALAITAAGIIVLLGFVLQQRILRPFGQLARGLTALHHGGALPPLPKNSDLKPVSAMLEDLHARRSRERELAYRDVLTGLGNRDWFEAQLPQFLGPGGDYFVLVLRLSRLPFIASTHGAKAADACLAAVGMRLKENVGDTGIPVRYGGGRMACLLKAPKDSAPALARELAATVLEAVCAPVTLSNGRICHLDARAGIAKLGEEGCSTGSAALESAEAAIHHAQQRGTAGNVHFFSREVMQGFHDDDALSQELDIAIAERQLVAHFEPVVDLKNLKVVAVEALARWHHPTRGLVMPGQFIPLAERTGQIRAVDALLFDIACQQLMRWHASGCLLQLSFNLSPHDITQHIVPRIQRALELAALPRHSFVAELTETAMLSNAAETAEVVRRLHALGADICLDDFGTGYSSLSYLLRLPIGKLKIDRSFTAEIGKSAIAERIIEATLQLAQGLEIHVVAEGVETQAQMHWLLARGCHLHQGWLYAKAAKAEDFNQWLKQAPEQLRRLRGPVLVSDIAPSTG